MLLPMLLLMLPPPPRLLLLLLLLFCLIARFFFALRARAYRHQRMSACGFEGARGAFLSCKEKRRQQMAAALVLPLRIIVMHNKNAKQARFVHAPCARCAPCIPLKKMDRMRVALR